MKFFTKYLLRTFFKNMYKPCAQNFSLNLNSMGDGDTIKSDIF